MPTIPRYSRATSNGAIDFANVSYGRAEIPAYPKGEIGPIYGHDVSARVKVRGPFGSELGELNLIF